MQRGGAKQEQILWLIAIFNLGLNSRQIRSRTLTVPNADYMNKQVYDLKFTANRHNK